MPVTTKKDLKKMLAKTQEIEQNQDWIPSLRISTVSNCNHRCAFCQLGGDFSSASGLTSENWAPCVTESMKRFFDLGVRHFTFTGGEPLLNPQLTFELGQWIRKKLDEERQRGDYNNYLRINTNGVLITKNADAIAALFDLVKISLHSLQSETYASITGSQQPEKDLDNVIKGINALNRKKTPLRLQCVVTKTNQKELWNLIEFCQQYPSIKEIKFFAIFEYTRLWRNHAPGSSYWRENYVPLSPFEDELKRKANFIGEKFSSGGYGNPMRVYELPNGLHIRLTRSDLGAFYGDACQQCPARSICADGHCNLEIGPTQVIKVCRPTEGKIFNIGQENQALQYFRTVRFNSRTEIQPEY